MNNLARLRKRDPALADRLERVAPAAVSFPPRTVSVDGSVDAVILVGAGHLAPSLARAIPPRTWIAILDTEERFRALIDAVDLGDVLDRPNLRLFIGDARREFRSWLESAQILDSAVIPHEPPPGWAEFVEEALNRRRTELATLVANAEVSTRNWIGNFPWAAASAGVASFAGRFAGMPAAVVASGPSLESQIGALRSFGGVIVAAAKSLRLLLANGIVPHFACHLDLSPDSLTCFRDLEIPRDVVLVWDPESAPVPDFPGDRVTFETSGWGTPFWGSKGTLGRGLTVAHTAFLFARHTGADPIALVGVDLAFPGAKTHAEGVTMTWGGAVDPLLGAAVDVPSVLGGTVRSIPAFRAMVTLFEEEIAATKAKVVNTSRIGALIRGAVGGGLPSGGADARGAIRAALAEPRPFDRDAFRAAAERMLASATKIEAAAESGAKALRKAAQIPMNAEEFARTAGKVNRHRAEIVGEAGIQPFLQRLLAPEAAKIQAITREMDRAAPAARGRLDVERTGLFFDGYRRAVRIFRDAFGRTMERMR